MTSEGGLWLKFLQINIYIKLIWGCFLQVHNHPTCGKALSRLGSLYKQVLLRNWVRANAPFGTMLGLILDFFIILWSLFISPTLKQECVMFEMAKHRT